MLKLSNTLALEYCVNYFLTIDDLYMVQIVNLFLLVVDIWFFEISNFDFEVKVKMGSPFCKHFWKLTICTIVQKIVILRLLVVEICFFLILVWTESKGQIGVTFL